MVGLIILGIIAAIIIGICLIPVGADIGYVGGELSLSAKVCGIMLQLLPKAPVDETHSKKTKKPKKAKKPKKEKKKKEKVDAGCTEGKPKKKLKLSFNKDEIFALVKTALKSLGKFGRLTIDRFLLHFTAGGDDPYKTAMTYNYLNATLSALAPYCKEHFIVKDADVWTDFDYSAQKNNIDFGICVVIRIGQVLRVAFALLFGALWILIKNKLRLTSEKIKNRKNTKADTSAASAANEEISKENIQENERNDSNG